MRRAVFTAVVWPPTPASVSRAGGAPTAPVVSPPAVAVCEQLFLCVWDSGFLWKHSRGKTDWYRLTDCCTVLHQHQQSDTPQEQNTLFGLMAMAFLSGFFLPQTCIYTFPQLSTNFRYFFLNFLLWFHYITFTFPTFDNEFADWHFVHKISITYYVFYKVVKISSTSTKHTYFNFKEWFNILSEMRRVISIYPTDMRLVSIWTSHSQKEREYVYFPKC